MKRIFLSVILILGVSMFIGLVFASQMSQQIIGYGTMSGEFVEIGYFNFEKGWNLVYGLPNPSWLSGGEVEESNIKVIYGFDPVSQKYIRFYPNPNNKELSSDNLRIDTMVSVSAFWVYSDKKGRSEIMTLQPAPVNEKRLLKGWNFIGITPDMFNGNPREGGTFSWNSIKGSCNLEKIYAWNSEIQDWMVIALDTQSNDFNDFLGAGMLLKTNLDCKLGTSEVSSPPQIPGDNPTTNLCSDSDGGVNYNLKGTVTGYNEDAPFREISSVADSCSGSILHEWSCKNSQEYDDESYTCPKGCNDGACIGGNTDAALTLRQNFGKYALNTVLGKDYVLREYRSLPLSTMVDADAVKYGEEVGINAIVIQFEGNTTNLFYQILSKYLDSDWTKQKASNGVWDIYQKTNTLNRVGAWYSGNYVILIHSSEGFRGDAEDLLRAYLTKYPLTLT